MATIPSLKSVAGIVDAIDVTPNDDEDLAKPARGVYIGTTGSLQVTLLNGRVSTFPGLLGGMMHAIPCIRVWNTGTDAATVKVLY